MSEPDKYTEAWKTRLKAGAFFLVLIAILYVINEGLWLLDKIVVASIITAFVPIKALVIIRRTVQLWLGNNKKIFFAIFGAMLFVFAFIFDINAIPEMWAYRMGVETKGTAVKFVIKSKNTHFITYEFIADGSIYRREQEVTIPLYESLEVDSAVSVKYLPNYPRASFLVDSKYLKLQTLFVFYAGFAAIIGLYANVLEEKVIAITKDVLPSRKPA